MCRLIFFLHLAYSDAQSCGKRQAMATVEIELQLYSRQSIGGDFWSDFVDFVISLDDSKCQFGQSFASFSIVVLITKVGCLRFTSMSAGLHETRTVAW